MKRPQGISAHARPAYTLVEMLVAITLTLILMFAVVQMFGLVGESVSDSRSTLEMQDRVRAALARLQMDFNGLTVTMRPPRSPTDNEGYFEYVEGPLGVIAVVGTPVAVDADGVTQDDTVTDFDDVLMFTVHSPGKPFVGRLNGNAVESHVAEVAWFVRGGNLYRRVLLVLPTATLTTSSGFYNNNDVSARNEGGSIVANTLGDLSKRENRYAHPGNFPFSITTAWGALGLPTLGETSHSGWIVGQAGSPVTQPTGVDFWNNPQPQDPPPPAGGPRVLEDVILSHVIGFDVKVWDPAAPLLDGDNNPVAVGAYVNLGTGSGNFSNANCDPRSSLTYTYCTWSTHYENSFATQAVDGFDNGPNGPNGVVDDEGEKSTAPPYTEPLRGIQVKIRVFEPDSRRIREVTLVQDFMPK